MSSKQFFFMCREIRKKKVTQLLMLSSVNLLPGGFVSYHLGGLQSSAACLPASLTLEIFINKMIQLSPASPALHFSLPPQLKKCDKIQSKKARTYYYYPQHLIKCNNLDRQREMNKVFKDFNKEDFLTKFKAG